VQAISSAQLRRLVPMPDAIGAMRDAFAKVANGAGDLPHRLTLADGTAIAMMARGSASAGTAIKVVSVRETNHGSSIPTIHAVVVWLDPSTGEPTLLIEGASVTALRTGAASGLATDLLAPPSAQVLAIVGAGGQAPDQIRGVLSVREITEIRICSRGGDSARLLAGQLADELPHVQIEVLPDVASAVCEADVVCCATTATQPVLARADLGERVHVNAIGSYRPEMRELERELLAHASIVAVDQRVASMSEAGEVIDAVQHSALDQNSLVEIGELVADPPADVSGLTVFKSVGLAMQDWAIAQLVSERIGDLGDVVDVDLR
jgi:ornithine cyclodeaminase